MVEENKTLTETKIHEYNMNIKIQNIGNITDTNVNIDKITLVFGNNGKEETFNKVLYCLLNSLHRAEDNVYNDRLGTIKNVLFKCICEFNIDLYSSPKLNSKIQSYINQLSEDIVLNSNKYINETDLLNNEITKLYNTTKNMVGDDLTFSDKSDIDLYVREIKRFLSVESKDIISTLIHRNLNDEFNCQLLINNTSNIELNSNNKNAIIKFKKNNDLFVDCEINTNSYNFGAVIYIDNPSVINYLNSDVERNDILLPHQKNLIKTLQNYPQYCLQENVLETICKKNECSEILNIINLFCNGNLIFDNEKFYYNDNKYNQELSNVQSNRKIFLILKTLLLSSSFSNVKTVILEYPDNNINPEYHYTLWKIIKMIAEKFNVCFVINSYSNALTNLINSSNNSMYVQQFIN